IALAALVSGCSSTGSEQSGSSRSLSEIFSSSSKSYAQAGTSGAATTEFDPNDCPAVDIRQGASTYSLNSIASRDAPQPALRYQGSFVQTARSCARSGNMLTVKVGVQGRIILGSAGGPGAVDVPVRFALVQEGMQPKTLWTRFYKVPVIIGEGQPSVT